MKKDRQIEKYRGRNPMVRNISSRITANRVSTAPTSCFLYVLYSLWDWRTAAPALFHPSILTCRVVVHVVVALGAVDTQKHLVVVVLVPVEGQDPGAPSLGVAAEEAGHAGHELGERGGTPRPKQGGERPEELLRALPLHQLEHKHTGAPDSFHFLLPLSFSSPFDTSTRPLTKAASRKQRWVTRAFGSTLRHLGDRREEEVVTSKECLPFSPPLTLLAEPSPTSSRARWQ